METVDDVRVALDDGVRTNAVSLNQAGRDAAAEPNLEYVASGARSDGRHRFHQWKLPILHDGFVGEIGIAHVGWEVARRTRHKIPSNRVERLKIVSRFAEKPIQ